MRNTLVTPVKTREAKKAIMRARGWPADQANRQRFDQHVARSQRVADEENKDKKLAASKRMAEACDHARAARRRPSAGRVDSHMVRRLGGDSVQQEAIRRGCTSTLGGSASSLK